MFRNPTNTALRPTMPEPIFTRADEEHEKFVSSLGQLMLAWADVEAVLFKLLKHYAGVNDDVGRALFSGTRARAAMTFIEAIAENTQMEELRQRDLKETFAQIKSLNTMRDLLVHNINGAEQRFRADDPGRRELTDAPRASRKKNAKKFYIGSSMIDAMCADCTEACWRLHPHWDLQNSPFKPGHGNGIRSEWQFKSPNPIKGSIRGRS